MRDPKRIKRILTIIDYIWKQNPDLRLMQLIGNCFSSSDLYYLEDDDFEKIIKKFYKV